MTAPTSEQIIEADLDIDVAVFYSAKDSEHSIDRRNCYRALVELKELRKLHTLDAALIAQKDAELAIYKGRDEAKQIVINQLEARLVPPPVSGLNEEDRAYLIRR